MEEKIMDEKEKWNQVDVYFNATEMFKEDKNIIDMLLQKYLSGEFQEHVKLPVPFILLSSKLNTSTEDALDEIMKKYPYADPNLFICTPSTKDLADLAAGIENGIVDIVKNVPDPAANIEKGSESEEADVTTTEEAGKDEGSDNIHENEETRTDDSESRTYEPKERIALIKTEGYEKTYAMIVKTNLSHKALAGWCDQASQYDISECIEHSSSRPANSFLSWAPCCSKVIAYSSDFVCDNQLLMELGIKKDDVYIIFSPGIRDKHEMYAKPNINKPAGDNHLRNVLLKCEKKGFEEGFIFNTNAPHSILTSWCERFPRCLQKHPERKYDDYVVYSFLGYMRHEGYYVEHLTTFQNFSSENVTLESGIQKKDIYTFRSHKHTRLGLNDECVCTANPDDELYCNLNATPGNIMDESGISSISSMNKSQHRCNPRATLAGLPILAYLDKMNCELSPDIHCSIDADELSIMIDLLC